MPDPRNIVLTVGSLHYDIMVEADHLPRRDETAVGSRWYPKFGGKGGNQAVAARRAGAVSRMVGAVGADDFGRFLREHLVRGGVEDRFVQQVAAVGSGMSVAIMDAAGDYAATIVSGANLLIPPAALADPAIWNGIGLLVLQNEIPEAVNLAAASEARARGIRVVLNAAPYREMSRDFRVLVDILVVNSVEAEMMGAGAVCCLHSASEAAENLAGQFETVIVTAGAQGLAAWTASDERLALPAEKVTVVSSHGAGDAFIGALAASLVAGADLQTACKAAAHAAAMHVAGKAIYATPPR
ncbi:PfkB family carbohydrate kinase [Rhodobacter ferrooxidans]|uniref:PfkB domain protein n=1 Tax=Rhodobacter ferrooxidans TaxID=371731 RepID=C8S5M8_9RHOB|nr:PfkB family carbohydrate kinase [Rhodobacter sp. SW2]EEW23706.1 PfkB domain protein [Rhodobacter sp. SW2]